ncbi:MAG: hypothetical protein KatS3mg124_1566 [Porticoccaceae bacterium]|nr:MAG: hypothetical protein KatS3mg124_1566 [Porticoccaceae bacterium]
MKVFVERFAGVLFQVGVVEPDALGRARRIADFHRPAHHDGVGQLG